MLEILQKIWKKHLLYLDLSSNFNDTSLLDASELAILLSANAENYERYLSLKDFEFLLSKIDLRADIYSIQLAQVMSINSIKAGFFLKDDIIKALELLKNLSKQDDIISFLKALQTKTYDKKTEFLAEPAKDESPYSLQIFGSEPDIMAFAALKLTKKYRYCKSNEWKQL